MHKHGSFTPLPTPGAARRTAALAAALLAGTPARAHTDGTPPAPHDFWAMWSLDPWTVLPLVIASALYARGVHLAWRKAGAGRGVRLWQAGCFAGGIVALVAALVWPLDALGDSLFAAHMAQHIALMGLAAPLLVLGQPVPATMRAMPRAWQRALAGLAGSGPWQRGWGWLTAAGVAATLQIAVFLVWHAPPAIAVSLENDLVHSVMHGSILGSALLFWTAITRRRGRGQGPPMLALLVTFKTSLISGALLAFAPVTFYASYGTRPEAWGLSLLEDQQLAGLLMMTVGAMMYVVAALVLLAVWLAEAPARRNPSGHLAQPGPAR